MLSSRIISTILKHDAKQTSYKIALLRAINDAVLAYPDLRYQKRNIAIPLQRLAEYWLAYYWAFVDPQKPVFQGTRARLDGILRSDMAFRGVLTDLRLSWEEQFGSSFASDGFVLVGEMRVPRRRASFSTAFVEQYRATLKKIAVSLRQPVQYAGPSEWSVFARPQRLRDLVDVTPVPDSSPGEICLVVSAELWRAFQEVSLWVEALCIHEWSLFSETVTQDKSGTSNIGRGEVYALLTERPDNRRPLNWERNQIDLLMMEGSSFVCPWTYRTLQPGGYDLDHLIPLSVYPANEMWNLVPADSYFNSHLKRARLPGPEKLSSAIPHLQQAYGNYGASGTLEAVLDQDVRLRFSRVPDSLTPPVITEAVADLIKQLSSSRNLATF